ncbi:MAG TPA: hypothetical protein DEP72_08910 [Clostridiales bacterium]|nr:MAG: hypothetical protein A2Y18_03850 [Clostridiales bacterium GWD2_32_19]HCC08259.1 hypothetical protein [Clostridiales bacterium]
MKKEIEFEGLDILKEEINIVKITDERLYITEFLDLMAEFKDYKELSNYYKKEKEDIVNIRIVTPSLADFETESQQNSREARLDNLFKNGKKLYAVLQEEGKENLMGELYSANTQLNNGLERVKERGLNIQNERYLEHVLIKYGIPVEDKKQEISGIMEKHEIFDLRCEQDLILAVELVENIEPIE